MFSNPSKSAIPAPDQALPGRATPMPVPDKHAVLGQPLKGPFPDHLEQAVFGMGCFWGAEKHFWQLQGVYTTAVGYSAGMTPNPTYEEVCSGMTGQNEVLLVVFDPSVISYQKLLSEFWQSHNPTQGMQQGNDRGTQYRSGIYTFNEAQTGQAQESLAHYQQQLDQKRAGKITTEIQPVGEFYYAENYHQQYLAKNPNGYCGLGGIGINY